MHADEVEVDDGAVRRLVDAQVPHLADRPLTRLDTWGTDHVIYRLGDDLSVRLPKIGWAATQGEREAEWLPRLARRLPVAVPVPLFVGEPGEGYPYRWYVSPWVDGVNPRPEEADLHVLARDAAAFVLALQAIETTGAPPPRWGQRGGEHAGADEFLRECAEKVRATSDVDVDALLAVWDEGMHAPRWDRAPVWAHGDLQDGNMLVRAGRLVGVIDWGGLVCGDPSVELMCAWSLFDAGSRATYREALGFVDDATWLRGRAWATSAAVCALGYYRDTNPEIVARSWRTVRAVLDDVGRS